MQRSVASKRIETAPIHPIYVRTALHCGTGTILNLSLGGAYVSTPISILPCAHAYIDIPFPEKRRFVRLEAITVWENRGRTLKSALPEGYGFRFIRVSGEAAIGIQLLMDRERARTTTSGSERSLDSRDSQSAHIDTLSEILLGLTSRTLLGNRLYPSDAEKVRYARAMRKMF